MLSGLVRTDVFIPDPSPPQTNQAETNELKKPKMDAPHSDKETSSFKKFFDKSCQENEKTEVNDKDKDRDKENTSSPQKQNLTKQGDIKEKKEDEIIPNYSYFPNFFFSSTQKYENFQMVTPKSDGVRVASNMIEELFQKPNFSLFNEAIPILKKDENKLDLNETSLFDNKNLILPLLKNENIYLEENQNRVVNVEKNILPQSNSINLSIVENEELNVIIKSTSNLEKLKDAVKDFFPDTKIEIENIEEYEINKDNESSKFIINKNEKILPLSKKESVLESKNDVQKNQIIENHINSKTEDIQSLSLIQNNKDPNKSESLYIKKALFEQEEVIVQPQLIKAETSPEKPNLFSILKDNFQNKNIDFTSEEILPKIDNNLQVITINPKKVKADVATYDIEEVVTIQILPQENKAQEKKLELPKLGENETLKNDEKNQSITTIEKDSKKEIKSDKEIPEVKEVTKKIFDNNLKDNKDTLTEKSKIELPKENNFKRNESSMQMSHSDNSFKKEEKFSEDKKNLDDKTFSLEKNISSQEKTPIVVSEKSKADFSAPIVSVATRKAIDLSEQLQARGGGTAKVQIQDDKLGQIELNIQMKKDNSVSMEIKTSNRELKNIIENGTDTLKKSLEVQNITLTDIKVSITEKSSQSNLNSGGHFSSQQQSNHNSDNNSNNQNANQGFTNSFTNQNNQKFFQNQENDLKINPYQNTSSSNKTDNFKKVEKNSLTNIQRGANGSIKVLA
ncbi:flagellar hook-length control protein FliK [Fluviispira multicolorata]|uniref:Flagellar hook-length control protein-like C-terminal domain-containing protein n=1 Tax=Fluviispira multicolorata TaxID=2654512 RepID=A0A833N476_9BACT|nr:flagellar hook-length control protein FliK [Fluviispira multicolorata]KAB8029986.1 hypothetical protein GCL57_10645 [Fluviispira multicolorata]